MLDKLRAIEERWKDVEKELSLPDLMSDMKRYAQLSKEYKDLGVIVEAYHRYDEVMSNIDHTRELLMNEKDEEFRSMAKDELESLELNRVNMEEEIRNLLIPKDPEDDKNAIMEIRAGTGGDEASLFAGNLFRMYTRFCESKGWKTEIVDFSEGTAGGYKEVIFNITAPGAYGLMKYESGVHRVQRVPSTETMGRVHTSAASVIVMPEAAEWDVELKESDVRKDIFCSSGPGGQSVNTTKSAIRLTHIPTGIVVQCQDQKSQMKNYDKALAVLRSRLYEVEHQRRTDEASKKRKTLVSTGDRSEKIRTYNYPQSRVTDHRIGLSTYNLQNFMDGNIQDFLEALQLAENAEKMKEGLALA